MLQRIEPGRTSIKYRCSCGEVFCRSFKPGTAPAKASDFETTAHSAFRK